MRPNLHSMRRFAGKRPDCSQTIPRVAPWAITVRGRFVGSVKLKQAIKAYRRGMGYGG